MQIITFEDFDNNKTYYDQHVDILFNKGKTACTLQEGFNVLKLILAAEKSNIEKRWIKI